MGDTEPTGEWTWVLDPEGQRVDSAGTIHPPASEARLPQLNSGLALGETLGAGGMGLVRRALQGALQREVAVKTAHHPGLERELIREAMITGGLEHPGIVPVHGLEQGPDGVRLVMKRIDGAPWSALLRDPLRLRDLAGDRDPLAYQVALLVQVCDAVAYAHAHGVLHRDLKPENVMIGRFGEVYVLDWGIAVALEDRGRGLPLARHVRSAAGTPAYMSPEQARGRGGLLSPRSDVYLLGAMLFEVLTGAPPHPGASIEETLEAARRNLLRPLPRTGHAALDGLVAASLATGPAGRPADVATFRGTLRRWLETRGADELAGEAGARLQVLRDVLARRAVGDEVAQERVEALITEARFGFRQALVVDPEHRGARQGLAETVAVAAGDALARRDPQRAAALLGEHPEPPAELVAAVADTEAALAWEAAEIERMRRVVADHETRVGRAPRAVYGMLVGVGVGLVCVLLALLDRYGRPFGYPELFGGLGLFDLGIGLGVVFWDRWLPANLVTRRLRALIAMLASLITVHWLLAWWTGAPISAAINGNALLSGAMLLAAGVSIDAALLPSAGCYLVAWAVGLLWPSEALLAFGVATGASFAAYAALAGLDEGRWQDPVRAPEAAGARPAAGSAAGGPELAGRPPPRG